MSDGKHPDRCAYLQQQIADRDRFIAVDRSIIEQRDKEIAELRDHLGEIERMAARHEESSEWQASAAIPAILGRARRALQGKDA